MPNYELDTQTILTIKIPIRNSELGIRNYSTIANVYNPVNV